MLKCTSTFGAAQLLWKLEAAIFQPFIKSLNIWWLTAMIPFKVITSAVQLVATKGEQVCGSQERAEQFIFILGGYKQHKKKQPLSYCYRAGKALYIQKTHHSPQRRIFQKKKWNAKWHTMIDNQSLSD